MRIKLPYRADRLELSANADGSIAARLFINNQLVVPLVNVCHTTKQTSNPLVEMVREFILAPSAGVSIEVPPAIPLYETQAERLERVERELANYVNEVLSLRNQLENIISGEPCETKPF